jgi:hypothetical protein
VRPLAPEVASCCHRQFAVLLMMELFTFLAGVTYDLGAVERRARTVARQRPPSSRRIPGLNNAEVATLTARPRDPRGRRLMPRSRSLTDRELTLAASASSNAMPFRAMNQGLTPAHRQYRALPARLPARSCTGHAIPGGGQQGLGLQVGGSQRE